MTTAPAGWAARRRRKRLNSGASSEREGLQPSKGRRLRPLSSSAVSATQPSKRRRLSATSASKRLTRGERRSPPGRAPNSPLAPSAGSSSAISTTQHLQPSARRMSRQNKLHQAATESSMQESRHSCPLLLLLCHLRRRLRSQRSMGSRKKKLAPRSRQNKWQREARKNSMMRKCPQRPRRRALANQKVLRTKGAEPLDASKGAAGYTEARLLIRVVR